MLGWDVSRKMQRLGRERKFIEWYRARWEIEMFFHVLKTGCRVEALQLASLPKIERALALFMVVSWRIGRLMRLGRTCPDLPASLVFDADEIKAAYVLTKKELPSEEPRLNEVVRRVAMVGGFLARKGDGEPGVKTIWLGLQYVRNFVAGMQFMRDAEGAKSCVNAMRFASTVKMVEHDLRRGDFIFRYVETDDFGEPENAFLVCTFWNVNALAALDRR